jgi:septum formation protein
MLILASSSPRRSELLGTYGVPFSIEDSGVEELTAAADARRLPALNAARKAEAVAARFPDALVIGADTVILLDGRVIGKPRDLDDARAILASLSGREHEVITAVALLSLRRNIRDEFTASTRVSFRTLTPELIERYLELVPVLDKAGAYAIQDRGDLLIREICGDRDNVTGLPCRPLFERLRRHGC